MATSRFFPAVVGRRLLRAATGVCLCCTALSASATDYQSLVISNPANKTTIHDNQGRIHIDATLSPPLSADSGDRFVFIVDGVPMLPSRSSSLSLEQMDRGSHTLQVRVINQAGNTLITSPTTTVYMWHASVLSSPSGLPAAAPSPRGPQAPTLVPRRPGLGRP
jgi:hypothetical protein